uniref:Uncharacterized protein n=1 Tax=Anguilla anguilla TaxID=7936 RepID=A0A0E9QXX1_ANGAN
MIQNQIPTMSVPAAALSAKEEGCHSTRHFLPHNLLAAPLFDWSPAIC